jgi:hypothetical protein
MGEVSIMPWQFEDEINAPPAKQTTATDTTPKQPKGWVFEDELQQPESLTKSAIRTGLQIPVGAATATAPGMLAGGLALGVSTTPQQEELEHFERLGEYQRMFPNAPIPESAQPEQYLAKTAPAVQEAQEYLPTVQNIARGTENLTGIPLTPKNELQKFINFASTGGKLSPGTIPQRAITGASAATMSQVLQKSGYPEPIAEALALAMVSAPGMEAQPRLERPKNVEVQRPITRERLADFTKGGKDYTHEFDIGTEGQALMRANPPEGFPTAPRNIPRPGRPPNEPPSSPGTPSSGRRAQPIKPSQTGFTEAFNTMKGGAISEDFFNKGINALQNGKTTVASIHEPMLEKAKPLFENGQIKTAADLRAFYENKPSGQTTAIAPSTSTSTKPQPGLKRLPAVPSGKTPMTTEDRVGNLFSNEKVTDSTETSKGLKTEIQANRAAKRQQVKELFDISRPYLEMKKDIVPQVAQSLNKKLTELERIEDKVKSTASRKLQDSLEGVVNAIAYRENNGEISGYKPISAADLNQMAIEMGDKVDYDFVGGKPMNIFKHYIEIARKGVDDLIASDPQAVAAHAASKKAYQEMADIYDNPYTIPFLDKSNKDYQKIFNMVLKPDEFNQIIRALDSPKGKQYQEALLRELVERKLEPFLKPGNVDVKGLGEALNDLKSVLSAEQIKQVQKIIKEGSPLRQKNVKNVQKEYKKALEDYIKKNKGYIELIEKPPTKFANELNSIEGIRNLQNQFSKIPGGKELFEKMKDWKAADIITKGKIEPSENPKSLQEMLKDKDTLRLLHELKGPQFVNDLRAVVDDMVKIQAALDEAAKNGFPKYADAASKLDFLIDVIKYGGKPTLKTAKFILKIMTKENRAKIREFAKSIPAKYPIKEMKTGDINKSKFFKNFKSQADEIDTLLKEKS